MKTLKLRVELINFLLGYLLEKNPELYLRLLEEIQTHNKEVKKQNGSAS